MKKLFLLLILAASCAFGQTTTSVSGTVKDLTNSAVTSGQVSFTLQPGIDTTMSGVSRFSPTEVDCLIIGSGAVKALDGSSTCTVVNNTALQPSGTSYKVCIQPLFIQPGSCFVWYATGSATDITQQVPTPSLTPAYNLVDTYSNQTIGGNKNFTGTITFSGTLSIGALTLGGPLSALGGGVLGGTFTGSALFPGINLGAFAAGGNISPANLTPSGNVSETVGQNQYKAFNFDSVLWVDGIKYTTLAACYVDLPSTGGTCHIPPNYAETMAASLTMSKNNAGFIFEGPATISMGSNQVLISQGTGGVFIKSPVVLGGNGAGGSLTAPGVTFKYTGTGTAFVVGGNSSKTSAPDIQGINIDLTGAGSAAIGMDVIDVNGGFRIQDNYFQGKGGANTQAGLQMDDGGNFVADGIIEHNWFSGLGEGVQCNGNVQEITLIANHMFAGATTSTGYNWTCGAGGGNASYMFGGVVSAFTHAMHFATGVNGNEFHFNSNSSTTDDILFDSGSSNNTVYFDTGQVMPVITDNSGAASNNHVIAAGFSPGSTLNQQPATGALTGNSADQTIYTYTLPARALAPGKCIDVEMWANHNSGTAAVTLKLFFGGTTWFSNATGAASGQIYERANICNNAGSYTAQNGAINLNYPSIGLAGTTFGPLTGAESTLSNVIIKTTFNVAATDQVTGGHWLVKLSN